jgi:hypothetical protein
VGRDQVAAAFAFRFSMHASLKSHTGAPIRNNDDYEYGRKKISGEASDTPQRARKDCAMLPHAKALRTKNRRRGPRKIYVARKFHNGWCNIAQKKNFAATLC